MHATVVAALRRYLEVRARHGAPSKDSPLFLSSEGGFIAERRINVSATNTPPFNGAIWA
jgi:hypothetical protein